MTRWFHLAALAVLPATACTDVHPIHGIRVVPLASTAGDGQGGLLVGAFGCKAELGMTCATPQPAALRVRINNEFLVDDLGDGQGLQYRVLTTGDLLGEVGTQLPVGSYVIELVDDDDTVWFRSAPTAVVDVDSYTQVVAAADGAKAWTFVPADATDAATDALHVQNLGGDALAIERCEYAGADGPATCTALGTAPAHGAWDGAAAIDADPEHDPRVEVRAYFVGKDPSSAQRVFTIEQHAAATRGALALEWTTFEAPLILP